MCKIVTRKLSAGTAFLFCMETPRHVFAGIVLCLHLSCSVHAFVVLLSTFELFFPFPAKKKRPAAAAESPFCSVFRVISSSASP